MVFNFCDFTLSVLIVRGFAFAPVFKGQPLQHAIYLEVFMFLAQKVMKIQPLWNHHQNTYEHLRSHHWQTGWSINSLKYSYLGGKYKQPPSWYLSWRSWIHKNGRKRFSFSSCCRSGCSCHAQSFCVMKKHDGSHRVRFLVMLFHPSSSCHYLLCCWNSTGTWHLSSGKYGK